MDDGTITATGASPRTDGYLELDQYAAIGDGRSFALVGSDGSIDWMCMPQLDSPSVFGAILDPERGGRFALAPAIPYSSERAYEPRTNVLQTTFETDQGRVRVTDAVTIDGAQRMPWRELVREVTGLSGRVPMAWRFQPRPKYGAAAPELRCIDGAAVARAGRLQLALLTWGAGSPELTGDSAFGAFEIEDGASATLALSATEGQPLPLPGREAIRRRLEQTISVWRSWVARHTYSGPWTDAVERSLLAIKLLADERTGAIAAAGTTSLPEAIGGERNYDYRFAWVRDLCFTLDALMAVGMHELTQASVEWVLGATERTHPRIDPVYTLNGSVLRGQSELQLSGYKRTQPVHLGNDAGSQLQLGGFGDLIETIALYVSCGHLLDEATGERLADVADLLTSMWRTEDSGLWELGSRAQYGSSKLSVWVAFDRLLDLADRGQVPMRHPERWRRARVEVGTFIERELFSEAKNSYLLKAGSDAVDCGMLLAARRGFGEIPGPRINGTIDAIRRELHAGGPLLYRYSGMQDEENAFLACSFWLIEALARCRRFDEAAELMDEIVSCASDVGLFSEEMEPSTHAMRGNMPQALTHLSLISAADALTAADR